MPYVLDYNQANWGAPIRQSMTEVGQMLAMAGQQRAQMQQQARLAMMEINANMFSRGYSTVFGALENRSQLRQQQAFAAQQAELDRTFRGDLTREGWQHDLAVEEMRIDREMARQGAYDARQERDLAAREERAAANSLGFEDMQTALDMYSRTTGIQETPDRGTLYEWSLVYRKEQARLARAEALREKLIEMGQIADMKDSIEFERNWDGSIEDFRTACANAGIPEREAYRGIIEGRLKRGLTEAGQRMKQQKAKQEQMYRGMGGRNPEWDRFMAGQFANQDKQIMATQSTLVPVNDQPTVGSVPVRLSDGRVYELPAIRKGNGDWQVLDPKSFEASDNASLPSTPEELQADLDRRFYTSTTTGAQYQWDGKGNWKQVNTKKDLGSVMAELFKLQKEMTVKSDEFGEPDNVPPMSEVIAKRKELRDAAQGVLDEEAGQSQQAVTPSQAQARKRLEEIYARVGGDVTKLTEEELAEVQRLGAEAGL